MYFFYILYLALHILQLSAARYERMIYTWKDDLIDHDVMNIDFIFGQFLD